VTSRWIAAQQVLAADIPAFGGSAAEAWRWVPHIGRVYVGVVWWFFEGSVVFSERVSERVVDL